ncbi:TPA: serine-type D-Ala-D-Ala carboxypeptidase [Photobacterium damselae]
MFKQLLCVSLLATSLPTLAAFNPQAAIAKLPQGHDLALLIKDPATGKIIYQQRTDNLQAPASTQKTITALAAKLYLGDNFRFYTDVETKGKDIIFNFSGDPTFSRTDLRELLSQIRAKGYKSIQGNIYLNGGHFTGYERGIGWPWDILGSCYSAPSSSITLEHNCVQGALYTNKGIGNKARVNVPSHQPIQVTSTATIVTPSQKKAQFCQLDLISNPNNSYQVSGCSLAYKEPMPLKFAVQNTTKYTMAVLRQELKRAGISFKGQIYRNDTIKGQRIARNSSKPMSELLDIMLKRSDNLFADNIAKTIGAKYYQQPGSYNNGVAAIKEILKTKANIDLSDTIMVDGSGLSRNNRLSANDLMQVITYIYKHKNLKLFNDFPVAGESGTLRYRKSMRTGELKGKVIAKSGSLFATYNLAGMIKTKSGKPLLFVQLVTDYHPITKTKGLPPISQFEQKLYQSLYQQY